ncbi:MAG: hypothetical protein AMXMBFR64_38150 [Myxococcales bacterium]
MDRVLRDSLDELRIALPPPARILLVDDEVENLAVLETLLEDDWDVQTAGGGAEALALLEGGDVDLVISDQRMPEMTGVELLARIAVRSPDTIRIVLTGYTDAEPMVRAINEGAIHRFLLKPWDRDEMLAAVRESLEVRATQLALQAVIRERTRRNDALRETLDQLRHTEDQIVAAERLSTLGRLTAGIAHDIRNQAHVMLLLVDTVKMESADPAVHAAAELARTSLKALVDLVQDVNSFAGAHARTLHRVPVPTRDLLTDAASLFALEPGGKGRAISVDVELGADSMDVSVQSMRQALVSLMRNGAAASADGAPLLLRARTVGDDRLSLEVVDQGCGMTPHELKRAVEPFFSGFDPPGLGLGLEIVRLVAEAHDGHLVLESTPGQGTMASMVMGRRAPIIAVHTEEVPLGGR